MQFRNYSKFEAATVEVMQRAYDAVVLRRNLTPDDPRTSELAATIAHLAAAGVTDLDKLTEQAASALKR